MPTDLTLSIDAVRRALDRCLDECEAQFGAQISVDADYYWCVNIVDAFDLAKTPSVEAAQLTDDLDSIAARNASPDGFYLISHEIAHLLGPLSWLALRALRQSPQT